MALVIRTDGTREEVTPENGRDFKLAQLYQVIGCELVEIIRLDRSTIMVIDEEGKCVGKPVNRAATALASRVLHPLDVIVGDAVVCQSREVK